jgi:hypothetical protein
MLNTLHTTSASTKHRHSSVRRSLFGTLVVLVGGGLVTPGYSLAAHRLPKCASVPVAPAEQCHLDLNDRMKMDLGSWGNGVHPRGPNYFCVQHQRQLEAQARACR